MGATTDYFAGLWRGVPTSEARPPSTPTPAGKTAKPAVPFVLWNVRLIGEALSDRSHVAAFEEKWFRRDRTLRCTRTGTMKFMDGALVMRVRTNDCAKHWDDVEKIAITEATATSVLIGLTSGQIRYQWLRNAAAK